MSIAQNPVMGQMTGSFANVNTYVHKGQNVVSSKAFNRKDANTDLQKAQRASFKLIADAYQSLGGFAQSGLPVRPATQSAYNYFMALNLPAAIDSSGETPVIDYGKLQIAKGSLPAVSVTSAVLAAAGITLSLASNIDFPRAEPTDLVQVIAKTKMGALYATSKARGSETTASILLALPNVAKIDVEFVYVFVSSADGKKASNSAFVELG